MQLVATKIVCQQKTPDFFGDSKVFISHATMTNVIFVTPARTLSISGLKSRVFELSFLSLKMMVKSGLEFILKLTEPLQS